ncbi:MAG: MarP family serine protease [Microthrixaceae bacterium]
MNLFDIAVVLAALLAIAGGWRLGLVTRALGWLGALAGLAIAVAAVPALTNWMDPSSDVGVLLLTAGGFVALVAIGQSVGVAIGSRLRPRTEDQHLRIADSLGGSVLGVVGVVVIVWLLVPLLSVTEGWVSSTTRTSAVARAVSDHLPEPPARLRELERNLANGSFPELFANLQPSPELPPPPDGSPIAADLLSQVAASSARVQGEACGLVQSGSAFSVGDGIWLTNAHVVAGTELTTLTAPDGTTGTGRVVAFDPATDLAMVRSDLLRPALALGTATESAAGLVLGFPGGGPFEPSPHEVGDMIDATGYDIYDQELVRRPLLVLSANLEPGDSGSAVLDSTGALIGIAVAIAPDQPGVAYALDVSTLAGLAPALAPIDTGDCLD